MARPHQRLEHEAMLDEPELRELFVEAGDLRSELTSMNSIRADGKAPKCNPAGKLDTTGVLAAADVSTDIGQSAASGKSTNTTLDPSAACLRGFALGLAMPRLGFTGSLYTVCMQV
ncbi:hypothetical protein GUITHDRAFT_115075 [Guillardia theta CCMP2712]|uniref:Uncharacterized protein n=1 Tax=Guillardia theta (strain CCMP2712) TaxID=905079 RepID=L1IR40_GUITC|nr:hypothetical protein GUITHDRAFT_115075 [Guillardia theta CCMP2712]EKX38746.1 hypothetical protein GUITHDRAFT_115075 [Guillardia theta CCMP2712]|eukprot:XP_005825726.1 hypothetical protein GUITHDRAFT_115075 [Guillardia theta CCMP2712]